MMANTPMKGKVFEFHHNSQLSARKPATQEPESVQILRQTISMFLGFIDQIADLIGGIGRS